MRDERSFAKGVLAVGTTYVGFLLFAQFGFLAQVRRDLGDAGAIQAVMAAMGIAGLAASLATGALLDRVGAGRAIRASLVAFGLAAIASLACHEVVTLAAAAAAVGATIGALTVAVAASLRALTAPRRTGLAAGLGTGLAYLLCNVPVLFEAVPAVRALVPAALAFAAAALLPGRLGQDAADDRPFRRPAGLARAIVAFAALVLLDSAAFAVIQTTPALKAATWGSAGQKLLLGSVHLGAAVGAGLLLDAGLFAILLAGTWVLFALAFPLLLGAGPLVAASGPLYVIGISTYSTALVVFPSRASGGTGPPARWRAALVYGIAGWLGSALGVGAAQDLGAIPSWLIAAAGAAVLGAWVVPARRGLAGLVRRGGVTAGVASLGLAGYWGTHILPPPAALRDDLEHAATRGREVYIAEGCIHCHSQYVRPGSRDERLWGPARPLDRRERPVLVGNRRQGPDLLEVGNRRAPLWNAEHLRDPRRLTPGSRMPSYAHLFAEGDVRGRDLVVYLSRLGMGTEQERGATIRAEAPPRAGVPPSAERGRALFGASCAACHGPDGRGDGPFAAKIDLPALNLRKETYETLRDKPPGEPVADALARVVRHGFPPTPMPGHETWSDQELVDVVAYVMSLAPERTP